MNIWEIKRQHKLAFVTNFEDGAVIWKPLDFSDYRIFRQAAYEHQELSYLAELEEEIYQKCLIYTNFDDEIFDLPAGVISTVVKQILTISGAKTIEEIIEQLNGARLSINNSEDQIIAWVAKAFGYLPEDLEKMSWLEILKRLAQAELVLGEFKIEPQKKQKKFDPFLDREKLDKETKDIDPSGSMGDFNDFRDKQRALKRAYLTRRFGNAT